MISKKSSQESETISLCLFFGSYHAIDSKYDKGNRKNLSHIEWERGFEGFLHLLGVLNEEAEGEDICQTEAEVPACANLLRHLLMQNPHDQEE